MAHFHIQNAELLEKLKALKPFQSKEETRYYLNGVYFHTDKDGDLIAVALDGHIMCVAKMLADPAEDNKDAVALILPSQAVDHLIKIASSRKDSACLVDFENNKTVKFDFGDCVYSAKGIDGEYPDYTKVMPSPDIKLQVGLNAKYLKHVLSALGNKPVDISTCKGNIPEMAHLFTSDEATGIQCVIMPMAV